MREKIKFETLSVILSIWVLILLSCNPASKPVDEEFLESLQTPDLSDSVQPLFPSERNSGHVASPEESGDGDLKTTRVDTRLSHSPVITSIPLDALVVTNGTVIDGTGKGPLHNGIVVIQGDRILAVGQTDDFPIPPNVRVIDVAGQTIMPGIINAHIHHGCDPVTRHHFLIDGVTAVCDLGASLRSMPNFEREYTTQNLPAARGFRAGPMITVPGGYPATYYGLSWHCAVATPAEAQAAVTNLLNRGADVIKIALEPGLPQNPWPVLSAEQVQAIVTTAHAQGVLVRAHVRQAAMLDIALEAGVDVIEHVPTPFCLEAELEQMLEDDALYLEDFPNLKAQLTRMARQEIILVPTLDPSTYVIGNLSRLDPLERQSARDFFIEIVRYFKEMGGVVALGNDFGNPGVQHGMPLREMKLLLAAGFSPMEVIEASTRHVARVSGHGDELGTLEPGKLADLIIVDGNPLADMEALNKVSVVIKGGVAYQFVKSKQFQE